MKKIVVQLKECNKLINEIHNGKFASTISMHSAHADIVNKFLNKWDLIDSIHIAHPTIQRWYGLFCKQIHAVHTPRPIENLQNYVGFNFIISPALISFSNFDYYFFLQNLQVDAWYLPVHAGSKMGLVRLFLITL